MQKYYSQADIVSMLTFIGHPNRNAVGRLFKLPKNSRREKIDEYSKIFSYKEICKTLRVGLLGLPKRFLTIEDVMYLLNVDRGTVLLLIDKGFLKNYYPGEEEKGRRILFHPKEIENYFSDISYFIWNRRKIKDEEIEDEEKTEGREILRGKVEDKEKIEDILITLTNQIHVIDLAPNGNYFVFLVVDSSKANLGITRSLLARYKKDLQSIF